MGEIRGVLFDYGLVLSGPPRQQARARMEQLLQAEGAAFEAAYWAERDEYDRGLLGGEAYWHAVAARLGRTPDRSVIEALLEADGDYWSQPNHTMVGWAMALADAKIKVGILSNMGSEMETALRTRLPWLRRFSFTCFSHSLRITKPELAIYRHALSGLDVAANEVLFVDDRAVNVEAARLAGLKALQYSSDTQLRKAMEDAGLVELLSIWDKVA